MMIGVDLGSLCKNMMEYEVYMRSVSHAISKQNKNIFMLGICMMFTGAIVMSQEERISKLERKVKRLEEEQIVG